MRVLMIAALLFVSLLCWGASEAAAAICDCCGCTDCVAAFYFHTNLRCATCKTIEQYTKEAIEGRFGNELESNRICFQVINTEEKGNEHYMADYQLYTKAVVLALVRGNKQVKFTNLTRIWELTRDKQAFQKYVADEIGKYLKELEA